MVSKRKVELAGFDDETCVKKGGGGGGGGGRKRRYRPSTVYLFSSLVVSIARQRHQGGIE